MRTSTCLSLAIWLWAVPALAHKPSDGYLMLHEQAEGVSGHLDVALVDLDHALLLDADRNGSLTWGEVRRSEARIQAYVRERLAVRSGDRACALVLGALGIVEHSDGTHARLLLSARCGDSAARPVLHYALLFDVDPQHRGLVELKNAGGNGSLTVLTTSARTLSLDTGRGSAPESGFFATFRHGVTHIFEGLDHVLFLLALLLPAVLRRDAAGLAGSAQIQRMLADVVKTVTSFTLAHSLTLVLSALSLVSLPSRLVEPAIALSVALAAANNLRPVFHADRWAIAFALGLLHGFGFSSALTDLGLTGLRLLGPLCAFNLGVEAGQLAIVLLFVPLALVLKRAERPRLALLHGGSLAILALSLFWVFERLEKG